jgi:hemoglobin-like flavoprotein
MQTDYDLITWSLERLAERQGDPTEAVYARLFAQNPDLERLFVLDRQGAVRGSMLANVFDVLLDMAGPRQYGFNLALAERATHEAMGVARADYVAFFNIVMETVRVSIGEDWRPEVDSAWRRLLAEIGARLG